MSRFLPHWALLPLAAALLGAVPVVASACEGAVAACTTTKDGSFALIAGGRATPVIVEPGADPAVRHAAGNFAEDLGRVGGVAAQVIGTPAAVAAQSARPTRC